MPQLPEGAEVGPYRIEGVIGAGGMGVVYRAHDSRVGRDVAIKMLPAEFTADADRLHRFEQEARAVGALNHPNLVTLYDVGTTGDQPYLVTELIDGDTLRMLLASGPLQLRRAREIAAEAARGLAAAHAKGIVHRDLKPENIMVTRDGRVKVLDFGIAKLRPGPPTGDITTQASLHTQPGTVMGTVGYMSPEQVRGEAAGPRADIFALGAILFELLTGHRAFDGKSRIETQHAVLHADPLDLPVAQVIPAGVEPIVRRCLDKDPESRFESARDLAFALGLGTGSSSITAAQTSSRRWLVPSLATLAIAGAAGTILVMMGLGPWKPAAPSAPAVTSFVIDDAPGAIMGGNRFAVSPDGTAVVYRTTDTTGARLYLRRFDQFDAKPIPGTETAAAPFFSPDGQWIGFSSGSRLRKLRLTAGEAPVDICDAEGLGTATWAPDNTIIFASTGHGLQRVSADGGEPHAINAPDTQRGEVDHHDPRLLPGGNVVIFSSHQRGNVFSVVAQSLTSGKRTVLIDSGFAAQYLRTGHLAYVSGHAVFVVPFDSERVELAGKPVKLIDGVNAFPDDGYAQFAVSPSGALVFVPTPSLLGRTLAWVGRSGSERPLPVPPRWYSNPRVSPDGGRVAVTVRENGRDDIWVYQLDNESFGRVTSEGSNRSPIWTHDGRQLTYTFVNGGTQQLMSQAADHAAPAERLLSSQNNLFAGAWTPDDRSLIYVDSPPTDFGTISLLPKSGERPQPLVVDPQGGAFPTLSPDGRWLAFVLSGTAKAEIFVQPFPGPGPRRQLTVDGGREPVWSHDGRELIYRGDFAGARDQFFALRFDSDRGTAAGKPVLLFQGKYAETGVGAQEYDVAPDAQRFLVVKPSEEELQPRRLHVVLNWASEVARRAPR